MKSCLDGRRRRAAGPDQLEFSEESLHLVSSTDAKSIMNVSIGTLLTVLDTCTNAMHTYMNSRKQSQVQRIRRKRTNIGKTASRLA